MTKSTYKNSRFAGEMLVAAELARLGYEVGLGNIGSHHTRAFDLMAGDPVTGRTVGISVKALKSANAFLIDPEDVRAEMLYAFVITGPAGTLPTFYILTGYTLLADEGKYWGKYGRTYQERLRGIIPGSLEHFKDNWKALDESRGGAPASAGLGIAPHT